MERRTAAEVDKILADARDEATRVLDMVRGLESSQRRTRASVPRSSPARQGDELAMSVVANVAPIATSEVAVEELTPDVVAIGRRTTAGITVAEWCRALASPDEWRGQTPVVTRHAPASPPMVDHDAAPALPVVDVGHALGGPSLADPVARTARSVFLKGDSLIAQVIVPMVFLLVVLGLVLALMG